MKYVMGIDSGSVSLKAVVVDENANIVRQAYKKNSDLITTLKSILRSLAMGGEIRGVGVTGTGQDFISKLVGADVRQPEIVCQYASAIHRFPETRTIIDIGGQDSKMITVDDKKLIKDCMFNESCAAGTGAVIETIASELDVDINDAGDLALKSDNDYPFPAKCGVFARTSVVDRKNRGVAKEDILMGVMRGLVNNYFTVLAKGKILEPRYVFQGATAKNKALVKAFEEVLDHEIDVPEHPHIMGAYGIALITLNEFQGETGFKGYTVADEDLRAKTAILKGCSNECELTRIYRNGEYIGYIKNPRNNCHECLK